jgi:integrase
MTTRQLSRLFHEAAAAAGIKKSVTLHALRHNFATPDRQWPVLNFAVAHCGTVAIKTHRRSNLTSLPF